MGKALRAGLVLLFLMSMAGASARESCDFLRDPAFLARNPVAPAPAGELSIATLNTLRLFDAEQDRQERERPTRQQFERRIERLARYVAQDLGAPALLGLQEVEDETSTDALVAALRSAGTGDYRVVLGETAGDGDMRNALLVAAPLRVLGRQSLFARTPRAGLPLHDRLPLVVDVDGGNTGGPLRIVVVHMKSMRGLDSRDPDESHRVANKRRHQARELAAWARERIAAGDRLVVLGDFNAITGEPADVRAEPLHLLRQGGLVEVAGDFLKPSQRWTYRYRCRLDELDRVLVAPALRPRVRGYAISRGDTCLRKGGKCDAVREVSDHEGVVLRLGPR